ncbi:MAG: GNAT family N-acetyltransferase [Clostridia bacterium]|nr:GNAT family N-acetyltransferase [Clostridia bacterium]
MNAEIDISNVILKTERLTLRPWRHEDLDDFYEYASVDGVGQMAGWLPHENREISAVILARFISGKKTFAIEYGGKAIGSLGIEKYDEEVYPEFNDKRCREIGFVLAKPYWGRGLMPEAVKEVLRWLFEDMELDAVFCGHFKFNAQSARVQEKCGFRRHSEGTFETQYGAVMEHVLNVLTREEWLRRDGKPV